MFRRSLVTDTDDATEINLSPMIDCIFILLIFFIVTTVFVEESGTQINKPDAAEAPPDDDIETVVFEITATNKIMYEGSLIGIQSVGSQVKKRMSRDDVPVSIRSHEKASHGFFMQVWDQIELAGAKKVSFSTFN